MKIIHCADLHLDSKIETLPPEKSAARRDEVIRTFERICDYAEKEGVRAVIIAGDMFDTAKVSIKTKKRVFHAISSCENTDFLYLSGNHDEESFLKTSEDLPKNLKIFGDGWTAFNYGNTVISGVSFGKIGAPLAIDTLSLNPDKTNIVVLHGQVIGHKGGEDAENISIPLLKGKNIDFLALGHIHYYSENAIDERGRFAYCGCPEGRGFDETGKKGFVLLETETLNAPKTFVKSTFIPFSLREFYEETVDVGEEKDWYKLSDKIISDMQAKYPSGSLVKVILKGDRDKELDVDAEDFTRKLNSAFFFGKVYDRTALKVSVEDYAQDKSIKGEFVRAVFSGDLSDEEKKEIINFGLKALKGEI